MIKILNLPITKLILLAIIIRVALCFLPSFSIDQNDWRIWGLRLAEAGPANFYSKDVFTQYTPGFLYFLWMAGFIKTALLSSFPYNLALYDLLLKLPANIADILTGLIIYLLVKKVSRKKAILAFILYVFNPAIFFNSSIWGQFDSISTLLILLAIFQLIYKKNPELSMALTALAFTFKPQAIFFAPAFGVLFLLTTKPRRWLSSLALFLITFILTYLPFVSGNIFKQIVQINTQVGNVFNCTTCFAFNFWGIFGNWKTDTNLFLNIPLTYWGILLTLISITIALLLKPFRIKYSLPYIYLTISLSILSFFTFLTRMHERYVFPFFCFFLLAAIFMKSKKMVYFYILFSVINTINLYLPYAYYNYSFTHISNPPFINYLMNHFNLFSGIFFISYILLMVYSLKIFYSRLKQRYEN